MSELTRYDIHSIEFLTNPALAGAPAETLDMGFVRASADATASRYSFLVDHDYALMVLEAKRNLEGDVTMGMAALKWARFGWPEDWLVTGTSALPLWAPIYLDGAEVVQ